MHRQVIGVVIEGMAVQGQPAGSGAQARGRIDLVDAILAREPVDGGAHESLADVIGGAARREVDRLVQDRGAGQRLGDGAVDLGPR